MNKVSIIGSKFVHQNMEIFVTFKELSAESGKVGSSGTLINTHY